jgi:hypothetical protein
MRLYNCHLTQLPSEISTLSSPAAHVVAYLYWIGNRVFHANRWPKVAESLPEWPVTVRIGRKKLAQVTDLSPATIKRAIKQLKHRGLIESNGDRRKNGCKATSTYTFHPNGSLIPLLKSRVFHGDTWIKTRKSLLAGYDHFMVPSYVVTDVLPHLESREKSAYVALWRLLRDEHTPTITADLARIQKLSGLGRDAFRDAMDGLEGLELISTGHSVTMHDAETRGSLPTKPEESPRNYTDHSKSFNPVESFRQNPTDFLARLGIATVNVSGDELRFCCPFHEDSKPSASINTTTGQWRCFANHDRNRGNLWNLIRWMAQPQSVIEVHVSTAKAVAGMTLTYGKVNYHDKVMSQKSDYYDYTSGDGKPAFRKIRIEKPEGKTFVIFRWSNGKFVRNGMYRKPLPKLFYRWPKARYRSSCRPRRRERL